MKKLAIIYSYSDNIFKLLHKIIMYPETFEYNAFICFSRKSKKDAEIAAIIASIVKNCYPSVSQIARVCQEDIQIEFNIEALANSRYCIVVCSPSSANDKDVNNQVEWYISHNRESYNIFACIIDGTPCAQKESDSECLPVSLRHLYPYGSCLFVQLSALCSMRNLEHEIEHDRMIIESLKSRLAERDNAIKLLNTECNEKEDIIYRMSNKTEIGETTSYEMDKQLREQELQKERIRQDREELYLEREEFRKEIERSQQQEPGTTYLPHCGGLSLFNPLERLNKKGAKTVFSSVFAPAEVRWDSHMLIQLYLHRKNETEQIIELATEAQQTTQRRDYSPLQCKLMNGDKINVTLTIRNKEIVQEEKKEMIWMGSFTKCTFDFLVPHKLPIDELYCSVLLTIDGYPIGEMNFITKIVPNPRLLSSKVLTRNFKKVFISYSHKDTDQVQFVAKAYKAFGIKYFFDSDQIEGGDVFEEKIMSNIDSSDLFILCWSDNAAKSTFIPKEIDRALLRAYPQRPLEEAGIKIFPISIVPHAKLPEKMSKYHFEEIG